MITASTNTFFMNKTGKKPHYVRFRLINELLVKGEDIILITKW